MPANANGKFTIGSESVSWVLYASGVLKVKPPAAERFMLKLQPGEDPAARAQNEYLARTTPALKPAARLAQRASDHSASSCSPLVGALAAEAAPSPASMEAQAPLAPNSKSQSTGYYYAAVPTSEHVLPTNTPIRIDGPTAAGHAACGAIQRDIEVKGADYSYYYAHARVKDYHVPVVPTRIEADGSLKPWNSQAVDPNSTSSAVV